SMIRLKCPKCKKKIALDDSRAGDVGKCPDCGQRFRIPGEQEDSSPYDLQQEPEPSPPPEILSRPPDEDNDELDPATYSFDKEYSRQRKKRLKEHQKPAVRQNIIFV